jgi:proline dehydrogenase
MKNYLLSFDDTETAFVSKSDAELKRAYWLFKIISFSWLVRISPPFVHFALWAHLPVKGLIRATVYKHFCGGETIDDCKTTVDTLGKYGIGTILDYSVEGNESENDFNNALKETLATITRAGNDKNIPFAVFKPTGFVRFALLEKQNSRQTLSEFEKAEYEKYKNRIRTICKSAHDNNVPVFIDAEESWIQDAIDELAVEMMKEFNKEKAIVYNTLQMYRTGRIDYLKQCISVARNENYKPAFKIVRGAYMEKERKRAKEKNIPSPIQPDKASTDRDFNAAISIIFENIDIASLCCGTHNEDSSLHLAAMMDQKKLPNNHHAIWFSQLYGMSDHISFNLAKKGYNVAKYVPYGPVEDVLPYLIRRAQENTSVKGQTGRELLLIKRELKRRAKM